MRQIADQKMNVKLLIVGDGELRAELEDLITRLELNNFVMLLGSRSDINHFYQASDIFVLPSLHEGFPVTLTEAQTAGLPCVVSDRVSKETNITGAVKFLPIDNSSYSKWIEEIDKINFSIDQRKYIGNLVIQNHFDISDVAKDFKSILGISADI